MNEIEAGKLLARAAAFDNRQPSVAASAAWAEALHDVPADADAYAAVARYYGTPPEDGRRLWLEPHHVRTIRKKIRAERHGDTIAAYQPAYPEETPIEFVERRRAQLAAIGDGRLAPTPVRQLTGGPARSVACDVEGPREVNAAVGDPGGEERPYMPPEFRRAAGLPERSPELSVPCEEPMCRAGVRQPCVTPRGKRRASVHQVRARAAAVKEMAQ
ncbi:hypothetical protein [Streptomyces sp. B15]|uniref:zinc finger domain-containing protein n=1 Tax=Streptomyces sp. B15 TaxID=1537797 RepID=UPI001B36A185|nr:hypothetical protein [Streptomyces sp. B15]MBQ1122608.1 hypothetical protein [Streptomyces sp. B15]